MRALTALAVVALVLSAGVAKPNELHVLFVGNSLTETNDLPAAVASLARSAGRGLEYRTIAFGGYSLEDHWNQGDARAALASGTWDVVVMQQGPSALAESQSNSGSGRFGSRTRREDTARNRRCSPSGPSRTAAVRWRR